jgi:hypothetical protein
MLQQLKSLLIVLIGLLLAREAAAQPVLNWTRQYGDSILLEGAYANAKLGPNLYVHAGGSFFVSTQQNRWPFVVFTDSLGDSLSSQRFNFPNAEASALAVRPDEQTFVIFGIGTIPGPPAQPYLYLLKADAQGNELWRKTFHNWRANRAHTVIALPDGYLLIGGAAPHSSTPIPRGTIIKTDLEGNIQWERGLAIETNLNDAVLCRDGSIVAVGYKTTAPGNANLQHFLKRYSPAGAPLDSTLVGTPGLWEICRSMIHTADGGYALAGFINVLNGTNPVRNGQVIKLDSAWNKQWEHRVVPGWGNYDYGCELQGLSEAVTGELIVAGNFMQAFGSRSDAYLASIFNAQNTGVPIWNQSYGMNNGKGEGFNALLHEAGGTAMLTGAFGYSAPPVSVGDFYLARVRNLPEPYIRDYCVTPPQARVYWQATGGVLAFRDSSTAGPARAAVVKWEWDFGDGQSETLYDTTATYTWAARPRPVHTYSSQWQNAATTGTLTVTNNLGCTSTVTFRPFDPLGRAEAIERVSTHVYPNPFRNETTIEYGNLQKGQSAVLVVRESVTGREVQRQTLNGVNGKVVLQMGHLSSGLYFYQLAVDGNVAATGKMMLLKE